MKLFSCGILLLFLFPACLVAQTPEWSVRTPSKQTYGRNNVPIESIQGSPYLDNNFRKGKVITDDGTTYENVPLRYNCYLDVIEFQKENKGYEIAPKSKIKRAEFGWQKYLYNEIKSVKGYFGILAEGNATLLVRYSLMFYEAGPAQGFAEANPPSFDNLAEVFFITVKNAPPVKINNTKKLLETLGDKKDQVKSYISSLKLSTGKAEDMKKIVNYYNTL